MAAKKSGKKKKDDTLAMLSEGLAASSIKGKDKKGGKKSFFE